LIGQLAQSARFAAGLIETRLGEVPEKDAGFFATELESQQPRATEPAALGANPQL
jgi:hypothetical protein